MGVTRVALHFTKSASPYDRRNSQMEVLVAEDGPSLDPDTEPVPKADSSSSTTETA